jgi:hypothetical protein
MICTLHKILLEIKENEMGGACSRHGGYEKCVQSVCRKEGKEETTMKS